MSPVVWYIGHKLPYHKSSGRVVQFRRQAHVGSVAKEGEEAETKRRGEFSEKLDYTGRGGSRKNNFFQDGNYLSVMRGSGERSNRNETS